MRILMVTSEAVPFVKTGGLADVCGALPRALAQRGHDVRVVLPRYREVDRTTLISDHKPLGVPTGVGEHWCQVLVTALPRSDVPVYFLEHDRLFDRDGLYGPTAREGYADNCLRFTVLSRGALQLCHHLGWIPHVIHCHDWQAALVPELLEVFESALDSPLRNVSTLLTIHNLAYQGRFSANNLAVTGLGLDRFDWRGLEFHGDLCLLKGGIARATLVTTVSPTYASEIQTEAFGEGLDPLLRYRAADLYGVLNGIDEEVWNPATDTFLPSCYHRENRAGKRACAESLRQKAGLSAGDGSTPPLIASFIGRLAPQKGVDIILAAAQRLLDLGVQLVVLGTGLPEQEQMLRELAAAQSDKVAVWITFSEELAHLIYAGSDLLLMPSLYEPCGLNQLYALRYGTIPVVTQVGGLLDSVTDFDLGEGTGFVLAETSAEALVESVRRAVSLRANAPEEFERLVSRAMNERFGWDRSASGYEHLYKKALARSQRSIPREESPNKG